MDSIRKRLWAGGSDAMSGRFGSIVTAMATPFAPDGALDLDRAQELAVWLLDHGSDALVIAGSTGEAATLSDTEKRDLWAAVVRAVDGRAPVIAGSGTYDTAHSVHLTKEAAAAGCDAVLVVTPYYNRPPQRGLDAHFRAVAAATDLPNILYNIPGRTACTIEPATLLTLAEQVENIVAVKDATGDFKTIARIIADAPDDFDVYSGDDWAALPVVMLGGVGVISVASHLAGTRMGEMLRAATAGDLGTARKINDELQPLYTGLFIVSNPIPLKAAMAMVGQPVGDPRLPLVPATDQERERIRRAMEDAGAL
jgi:4-hydroxy-tetrahydrodipicolinate synthase